MTRKTTRRLGLAVFLPLLSLLLYWHRLHGDYSTNQLLLASSVAIVAATGLYLYAPIARKVERGSLAWGLLWIAVITLGAIGLINDTEAWGFPLTFFAIWAPIYHALCKQEEKETRGSFFKAPQKY